MFGYIRYAMDKDPAGEEIYHIQRDGKRIGVVTSGLPEDPPYSKDFPGESDITEERIAYWTGVLVSPSEEAPAAIYRSLMGTPPKDRSYTGITASYLEDKLGEEYIKTGKVGHAVFLRPI